jgi:uncharacterized lipoprotein YbaY
LLGELILALDAPAFDEASAWVRLEEVSRLDAPATTMAETRLVGLTRSRAVVDRSESPFPFELVLEQDLQPGARYTLRAQLTNDGPAAEPSFHSTQAVPVAASDGDQRYTICLVRQMGCGT